MAGTENSSVNQMQGENLRDDMEQILKDFDFAGDLNQIMIDLIVSNFQMRARLNAIYGHFPQIASTALGKEEERIEKLLEETRQRRKANILASSSPNIEGFEMKPTNQIRTTCRQFRQSHLECGLP
jgi:hypothetical protein